MEIFSENQVYAQSLHGSVVLDGDSWLVYWLDRALRHGLRIERHGYWGTARELSHQDTVVVIHALQNVLTSIGKGIFFSLHLLINVDSLATNSYI